MNPIDPTTLQALWHDQARLERIANNLANLQTPGYKRELLAAQVSQASDFARLIQAHDDTAPSGSQGFQETLRAEVVRDMRPGTVKATGKPLDLAILGEGYFELASEQGPVYTRRGEFFADASGRVVTSHGYALLGTSGEFSVASSHPTVDGSGRLSDGDRVLGQVRVVDASKAKLVPMQDGDFGAQGEVTELRQEDVRIRQGYLENSNVDPGREMIDLTATVRHYEALLRVVQGQDEMLGTAIRRLGEA